jgi:ABC-2 type transport system permease protein
MNTVTMKWLLRREFWEYKGAMFWGPVAVAALLVALFGGTIVYALAGHHLPTHLTINGQSMGHGITVALDTKVRLAKMATTVYLVAALPLFGLLSAVVFSYCLGALHDERRDRSILFWKSLPVSDEMTVLSKALTAMLVAPVITIVLATLTSLVLLLVGCLALSVNGMNVMGAVLTSPELYLSPLRLVALLPVYMVWALPTVGWLLLVSGWARTKPSMWAVGGPLIGLLIVKWMSVALQSLSDTPLNLMHHAQDLVARLLTGVVPGIWFSYDKMVPPNLRPTENGIDMNSLVTHSYATLATADAWIGFALGAAMLYGAVRLRRHRDEG